VLSVDFAKKIVRAVIRDEEFLLTVKQQLTGSFVPKYNWQSFIILIFVILNNFINKWLKLKSNDFMSDLDKCIDSKPNNNTGMHFEKTSWKVTSSGTVRPTFPKMALSERKKDFLC